MGSKGDNNPNSARSKTIAFQNDDRKPAPIPLENCPWCGDEVQARLVPAPARTRTSRPTCASSASNRDCDFTRDQPLPILAVDEPIYRRLPCFLIATVDKFAAMPWTGQVGALLRPGRPLRPARLLRAVRAGPRTRRCRRRSAAAGPDHPGRAAPDLRPAGHDGRALRDGPRRAVQPRVVDGKKVRPKIVASTATVRRAENQIQALFDRRRVDIFPPPGPDRRDSFFAETHPTEREPPAPLPRHRRPGPQPRRS